MLLFAQINIIFYYERNQQLMAQIGGYSELIPNQILKDLNTIFKRNVLELKTGAKLTASFVNTKNCRAIYL